MNHNKYTASTFLHMQARKFNPENAVGSKSQPDPEFLLSRAQKYEWTKAIWILFGCSALMTHLPWALLRLMRRKQTQAEQYWTWHHFGKVVLPGICHQVLLVLLVSPVPQERAKVLISKPSVFLSTHQRFVTVSQDSLKFYPDLLFDGALGKQPVMAAPVGSVLKSGVSPFSCDPECSVQK